MSPDQAPHPGSPEQNLDPSKFFNFIKELDPERMVADVAFGEIAGPGLAQVFLEGYADHLAANPESRVSGLSGDAGSDLQDAMCDIERSASYDASGDDSIAVEERFQTRMAPWRQAYTNITGETPPPHFLPTSFGH